VAALLDRCRAVDGYAPLSEFKELRLPVADDARTLVAVGREPLSAVAVAAWHPMDGEDRGYWAAEVAIDPDVRSIAAYTIVIGALEAEIGNSLALWTFDETQARAARASGYNEKRAIAQMNRSLPAGSWPLPDGFSIRPFVPGADEVSWLALNRRVFRHHPEAGGIGADDLTLRMKQPWFNPDGLLFLAHHAEPVGYCWTKLHRSGVGEIYMIGVVEEYRGRGLARPLTSAGLEHLYSKEAAQSVMLYAEISNVLAITLYSSMGFEIVRRIALYVAHDR